MEYRDNYTRFKDYCTWEKRKNAPYDYQRNGLIKHLMSGKIINSKNIILQNILKYYEMSIVFVFKYIDVLKHFKNYHWKNR